MAGENQLGSVRALEMAVNVCGQLSEVPADSLMRRLTFLAWEFQTRSNSGFNFQQVSEFIFEEHQFKIIDDQLCNLNEILLPDVIKNRSGIPIVVGLIFRALAEKVGLNLCFIGSPDLSILKYKCDGETSFIDLSQKGKQLHRPEMLELLQDQNRWSTYAASFSFETMSDNAVLSHYLKRLSYEYIQSHDDHRALIVYEQLLQLEPKNLSLIRDRAMINYRMKRFAESLSDLKRYFSFSEPTQQPAELVVVYESLQRQLQTDLH